MPVKRRMGKYPSSEGPVFKNTDRLLFRIHKMPQYLNNLIKVKHIGTNVKETNVQKNKTSKQKELRLL